MSRPWDPLRDLVLLQDRMNQLFEDATQHRAGDETGESADLERTSWTPAADVYETEAGYLIALDLPGIDRAALEIDVEDKQLVVRGNRLAEESKPHRSERPHGKFLRKFNLPASIDNAKIEAQYQDGVLQIELPRSEEQKAQRVQIKIS